MASLAEFGEREAARQKQFFNGNFAIAEAQKCGRMLFEQTGQRSWWCVATRKGFWPASYFFAGDEELLRRKLDRGHAVVLAFAVTRRRVLASCSDYQAVYVDAADEPLRRFARYARRHSA